MTVVCVCLCCTLVEGFVSVCSQVRVILYSMSSDECVYDEVSILTLGTRLFIMFCDFLPNVFLLES